MSRCPDCPDLPNGTRKRQICCRRLPGACIDFGHFWTSWSPWRAIWPDSVDITPFPLGAVPVDLSVKAVRSRRCDRCGCIERHTKGGEIEVVADPSGTEAVRQRRRA